MTKYFYYVSSDPQLGLFKPVYFETFVEVSAFVKAFIDKHPNVSLNVSKVSFNFG